MPSGLSVRAGRSAPALSITTSSRGSVASEPVDGVADARERCHVGDEGRDAIGTTLRRQLLLETLQLVG